MEQTDRFLRVGITAILCALVLRLGSAGIPRKIADFLTQPDIAAFLIYLETGRDVRFSDSSAVFSPRFAESPPAVRPKEDPVPETLPSFAGEEIPALYYGCDVSVDAEALLQAPLSWDLTENDPTVLILHTHSTESYTPKGEPYQEISQWRTLAEEYNMLSIGSRVGQLLSEGGIGVVQDRNLYDYPSYNGSYVRARRSIQDYLTQYPSIRLVLDLHRDASGGETQMRTAVDLGGSPCARLMLVLGTNHKAYEENLSLALKLHTQLQRQAPGIMRPLQLRAQRFNQDLSPGALLIEVGAAGNSHAEAMAAAEQLAEAILALAKGTE